MSVTICLTLSLVNKYQIKNAGAGSHGCLFLSSPPIKINSPEFYVSFFTHHVDVVYFVLFNKFAHRVNVNEDLSGLRTGGSDFLPVTLTGQSTKFFEVTLMS